MEDLNHHYWILIPTTHGQIHRLIPQSDAVELAFVFITYTSSKCSDVSNDIFLQARVKSHLHPYLLSLLK